ncbi:MAG: O-antigen/teichoic acid export membrane protein [Glaciecola sp.]|jgi:O-antigen/teichoic acid export membrane protein
MGVVKKQGIQNTIVSYVGSGLGFLNKVLLFPKIFVLEQVGLVNVLGSITLLYAQVAGFGVYNVIIRFFPQYQKENKKGFLSLIIMWFLLGFALCTGLFLIFHDYTKEYLFAKSPLLQEYFHWIAPLAFLVLFFEVLASYARALLKSVFASFLKDFVLRLLMTIVVVLFYFDLIDFSAFIALFVGTYFVLVLIMLGYFMYLGELKLGKLNIVPSEFKQLLKFGGFVFLAESSSLLVSNIDAFMLTAYNGLADPGIYTTMIFLTSAFLIPYRGMAKIATPIIPRLWKENKTDEIQSLYTKFSATNFFMGGVLFMLILANIELLFLFLPPEFRAGLLVFTIVGLARLAEVLYGINGVILVNSSKYKVDLIFAVILIVITIVTNYLFIPIWGMMGATVASFICIVLINFIRGMYLRRAFGFKLFNKQILLSIGFFSVAFAALNLINISSLMIEMLLKNLVVIILFALPVLYLKLAPEINKTLQELRRKF